MASDSSSTMIEYPFALEWEISEERLKSVKESTTNESLESDAFAVVRDSNFEYYLSIFPNGNKDENRGKTGIFLFVNLPGIEKKVEAEYTFSIESADWNHKINHVFEESFGYGNVFCTVDEFFDSDNKFIVDGKFTIKVEGILKIENGESNIETQPCQSKWERTRNFCDLWKIGYEDFLIVAGGKEIQVHKNVLASHSTVFDAMFSNTNLKEGIENRVEIIDFPLEVVENAVELCYGQKNVSDFSLEKNAMLLKFTDKYDIALIKENLEEYFSEKITVSNVCEMVKIAGEGNSIKLRKICLDFFVICLSKKGFIPNMELLDNDFFVAAIKNSLCEKYQTI